MTRFVSTALAETKNVNSQEKIQIRNCIWSCYSHVINSNEGWKLQKFLSCFEQFCTVLHNFSLQSWAKFCRCMTSKRMHQQFAPWYGVTQTLLTNIFNVFCFHRGIHLVKTSNATMPEGSRQFRPLKIMVGPGKCCEGQSCSQSLTKKMSLK